MNVDLRAPSATPTQTRTHTFRQQSKVLKGPRVSEVNNNLRQEGLLPGKDLLECNVSYQPSHEYLSSQISFCINLHRSSKFCPDIEKIVSFICIKILHDSSTGSDYFHYFLHNLEHFLS